MKLYLNLHLYYIYISSNSW